MRIVIAALACLALTGCQSVTRVTSLGDGNYMIGARSVTKGHTSIKAVAIKHAEKYCEKQGRYVVVQSTTSSGAHGWTPVGGEVMFRCEDPKQ